MSSESDLIPYHAVQVLGKGSVLVLAPHPDDEVLGCAGAILRHIAAGDRVAVVILTDGGGFHADGPERVAYVAQRRQESRAAAAILGYGEPQFWECRDRELIYDEPLVRRICATVIATDARWLYAPSLYELHPDHRNLALATLEAIRRLGSQQSLAFYEVSAPLLPNRLLDISDLLERKRQAIACFTSQLAIQVYDRHIEALNRYRTYTLPREIEAAEAYWVIEGSEAAQKLRMFYARAADWWRATNVPGAILTGPLVSVIVRSTGRPELATALASVATQTYQRIEIVVVDALGTGQLKLDPAQCRFPLRGEQANHPLGRSAAANLGLDLAQGDYLIFLDDDDWFEPDHLAGLVEQLNLESTAIAAYAGVRCVRPASSGDWETIRVYNDSFDVARLCCENFIPIHALLFRREALQGAAPCRFDERFDLYEDWDFWLQLQERGGFQHRDALSACYRIHEGGGLGVAADEQRALAAFQAIVTKWRSRWTDRELMDLIARARHLERLLQGTEAQRAEAVQQALTS
jgi:LmbE family N-acetylglucosaminyl deacetylase